MSEKPDKKRITVALPEIYIMAIEYLTGEGLFRNRSEIILEALRDFFKGYEILPFATKLVELSKDAPSE